MVERLTQQEQIRTPERSPEELYLDALEKKRDTLLAFHTMNSFRKSKEFEEMTPEELEQYEVLREDWRSKKESSFGVWSALSEDKQEELAAMGSRLYDVQAKLTLLKQEKLPEAAVTTEKAKETEKGEAVGQPEAEQVVPEQTAAEKPDSALTLADVDSYITRLEKSKPVPLLSLEAWKAKRAELAERKEVKANPDRIPPKGFLTRVKDAFDRARGVGPKPEQPEASQPEPSQPEATKETTEMPVKTKKDTFWTFGFWKERAKGLITPFGFLEFYKAEKFRRRTGEIAGDAEALATSIQQERNLSPEEAEKEAWEMVNTLKEQGLTISALEFYDVSKDITERKRKENDEEIAYIVKSAEDDIHDKLQKSGHTGEAGQELLTRENQLVVRAELMAALSRLRDGAVRADRKELAKLIRRNLDEKWNWRYVWGGLDAVLWFAGIAAVSMKFLASKEAAAAGAKIAAGGAGGVEAAREFVETGMHKNIWNTLEQMAKNGPEHMAATSAQLKEWSQGVLDSIKHYEPEWVDQTVEGLKSSRTMPENFPLKIPAWVMKAMGYPGF